MQLKIGYLFQCPPQGLSLPGYPCRIRVDREPLVPAEDVSCIDLILYVIKARVVAVGYNRMALCLECFKVVLNAASKITFILP